MKINCECGHEFNPEEQKIHSHRVMCGDSTQEEDVERLMDEKIAELLFTSPPYADMREYDGDELNIDHLIKFIPVFKKYANYQVINLGLKRKNGEIYPYWNNYIETAQNAGYKFLSWNVWNREMAGYSISQITAMFAIEHEWLLVFGNEPKKLNLTIPNKTAGEFNDHSWIRQKNGSLTKSKNLMIRDKRQLGTVMSIINEQARIWTKYHPAIFPIHLPEKYIEAMTNENDNVIDSFLGSGSTLVACEKLNRQCFGMEISPKYCDVICRRYYDFTGNVPILEETGEAFPIEK